MTKKYSKSLLLQFFLVLLLKGFGQGSEYQSADFRPPLDIPLYLSGTFGELRSNHFHAGIDIKTEGVEGKEVFAISDGYVSRLKVATGGYGKVLYITHPNGFVSVYAHLKTFNDSIQQFVKKLQYKNEHYVVEAYPEKGKLKVSKGEVIALSGNTGGSEGPHLHFEIREEATQYPVNPLFFDSIYIVDQVRPRIAELAIYPIGRQTLINGKNDTAFFAIEKKGQEYALATSKKITVSGPFSLGIRTYDQMNKINNKNGVFRVELLLDNEKVFGLEMDKLSFATMRYLNSLIDYPYFKLKKRRLIRTEIDTNNRLFIYRDVANNGIYFFSDTLLHSFKYKISDFYENTSVFSFLIEAKKRPAVNSIKEKEAHSGRFFRYDRVNSSKETGISLQFPANAFYRSFYFQLMVLPANKESFSPVFMVHNKFTPVQKKFSISIVPDTIPVDLKTKMYIAYMIDKGGHFYIGSDWKDNKLTAKSRLLGNYTVMADTIEPEIKSLNCYNGKNVSKQNTLMLTIIEKQTGIKTYRGTLNGQWILMEYNPKKNRLTYIFDEHLHKGKNDFKLVVKDLLGNEADYEATITY